MPYPYAYPYYMPPFINGGDYIRSHGYPTNDQFMDVKIPTAPITDPLKSGVQFGLLGAASGLGFSAIRRARDGAPGGWPVARDAAIGAALGTIFGALAAKENQRRWPGYTANSYSGMATAMDANMMGKSSVEKRAIAFLPALWAVLGALSAASAARSGVKAVGSAASGNWRGAAGHGSAAVGEGLMALLGAGPAAKVIRGASKLKALRPMIPALVRGGKLNNKIWTWGAKRLPAQVGAMVGTSTGVSALNSASRRLLLPAASRAAPVAPRATPAATPGAVGTMLRKVPTPQSPQFKALV